MAEERKLSDSKQIKTVFVGDESLPGMMIYIPNPEATAVVVQPFIVEVALSEEEYLVTSRISNIYELGITPGKALTNYLRLLVSELIWLQKHEDSLSYSIREELRHLQKYVQIV